jgi:hypothetical protein
MIRARDMAPLGSKVHIYPAAGGWTGNAPPQGSRCRATAPRLAALTRPRSQSVWLLIASARCADARPKAAHPGGIVLDNKNPIHGTSHARRSIAREGTARRARDPPVRYRDKPAPTPVRGPFSVPIRDPNCCRLTCLRFRSRMSAEHIAGHWLRQLQGVGDREKQR